MFNSYTKKGLGQRDIYASNLGVPHTWQTRALGTRTAGSYCHFARHAVLYGHCQGFRFLTRSGGLPLQLLLRFHLLVRSDPLVDLCLKVPEGFLLHLLRAGVQLSDPFELLFGAYRFQELLQARELPLGALKLFVGEFQLQVFGAHPLLRLTFHVLGPLHEFVEPDVLDGVVALVAFHVRLEDGRGGVALPAELADPQLPALVVEGPLVPFQGLLRGQFDPADVARVLDFQMYSLVVKLQIAARNEVFAALLALERALLRVNPSNVKAPGNGVVEGPVAPRDEALEFPVRDERARAIAFFYTDKRLYGPDLCARDTAL